MKPSAARERIRCRLIAGGDIDGVTELLCAGFPGTSRMCWATGLARLSQREVPDGAPRYGYCLDAGGHVVGVILLIASTRIIDGAPRLFTNVASWYVMPEYRAYAQLIVSIALRNKETTYTNVSPAPHTWPIVENQGYTRYCNGLFLAAAALKRPEPGIKLQRLGEEIAGSATGLPDLSMLKRHAELGCDVIIAHEGGEVSGHVFRRFRIRGGKVPLPAMFVIHSPDRRRLVRMAGNFGRHFLGRRAAPFLVMDADGPVEGLTGYYTEARGRKYFKGPHRPDFCDLADSEYAIFGV